MGVGRVVEDGWGARTPPRMPRPATTLPHHTPNPGAAFIAINVRMTALRAKYVPSSNNPRRIAEAGVRGWGGGGWGSGRPLGAHVGGRADTPPPGD